MAQRKLSEYQRKREFDRTPEPSGETDAGGGEDVIHEHTTPPSLGPAAGAGRRAVSWALPRGVLPDPGENRLVHTEDHLLGVPRVRGAHPQGEGPVRSDLGPRHVRPRSSSRRRWSSSSTANGYAYALFRTRGDDWMIHRMDPADPAREPMPEHIEPMKARSASCATTPRTGTRSSGTGRGRSRTARGDASCSRTATCSTSPRSTPSCARWTPARPREAVLDGEIVALDEAGDPSFQLLQRRMHLASDSEIRRRAKQVPVTYMVFDLLYAEGRTTVELTYEERRSRLEALELEGAARTSSYHRGEGRPLLDASRERGPRASSPSGSTAPTCRGSGRPRG